MPQLIAGLFALYLLSLAIRQFGRIKPAQVAKFVRGGFAPALLGQIARGIGTGAGLFALVILVIRGAFAAAAVLAVVLVATTVIGRLPAAPSGLGFTAGRGGASAKASTVRSAAVEMRLDRQSARMSGTALQGPFAGRQLDDMTRPECVAFYDYCLSDDPEGAALLETYLDRRFAAWREAKQGEGEARSGGFGGALTRNEAYEILGLPQGAGREEIIIAHRALMKKLHPDHGGSTALAARVNQAKDVLLG